MTGPLWGVAPAVSTVSSKQKYPNDLIFSSDRKISSKDRHDFHRIRPTSRFAAREFDFGDATFFFVFPVISTLLTAYVGFVIGLPASCISTELTDKDGIRRLSPQYSPKLFAPQGHR